MGLKDGLIEDDDLYPIYCDLNIVQSTLVL